MHYTLGDSMKSWALVGEREIVLSYTHNTLLHPMTYNKDLSKKKGGEHLDFFSLRFWPRKTKLGGRTNDEKSLKQI